MCRSWRHIFPYLIIDFDFSKDILAFVTQSGDDRLSIMQCHVVQGKPKEILALYMQIDAVIKDMTDGKIPMEHRPGIM